MILYYYIDDEFYKVDYSNSYLNKLVINYSFEIMNNNKE